MKSFLRCFLCCWILYKKRIILIRVISIVMGYCWRNISNLVRFITKLFISLRIETLFVSPTHIWVKFHGNFAGSYKYTIVKFLYYNWQIDQQLLYSNIIMEECINDCINHVKYVSKRKPTIEKILASMSKLNIEDLKAWKLKKLLSSMIEKQ